MDSKVLWSRVMTSRSADALYRSFCIDQAASQRLLGAVYVRCTLVKLAPESSHTHVGATRANKVSEVPYQQLGECLVPEEFLLSGSQCHQQGLMC